MGTLHSTASVYQGRAGETPKVILDVTEVSGGAL